MAANLGVAILELKVDSAALRSGLSAAEKDVSGSLKNMGMGMTMAGAAGIAAFGLASKAAISFDASIARTTGLTSATAEEMATLREEVLKLAPAVGKGPLELSKALYFILSAGIPAADAMKVLEASAKAASAGLGETKVVADAVTSVLNAYKLGADKAAWATDVLTQIVTQGKVPPEELAGSMGKVIGVAAAMGISFEEVGANIAVMTRVGMDAAMATTALRATMSAFLKPSEEMRNLVDSLGMSMEDLRNKIKQEGLLATLQMMIDATGGNTSALAELFPNVRALTDVLSSAGSQGEQYVAVLGEMQAAAGLSGEAFATMEATTSHKLEKLKASFDVMLISIGEEIAPAIGNMADSLRGMITWLEKVPDPIRKIGVQGGVTASALLLMVGMIDLTVLSLGRMARDAKTAIIALKGMSAIQAMTPMLSALIPMLGPLGLAGGLIAAAVAAKYFEDEIDAGLRKLPLLGGLMSDPITKLKEFSQAAKDLNLALEAGIISQVEYGERALPELAAAAGRAAKAYRDDLTKALGDELLAEKALAGETAVLIQKYGLWDASMGPVVDLVEAYDKEMNQVIDTMINAGYTYGQVRNALIAQGVAVEDLLGKNVKLEELYQKSQVDAEADKLLNYAKNLKGAALAAEDLPPSIDVATVAMAGLTAAGNDWATWVATNMPEMSEQAKAFGEAATGALDSYQESLKALLPAQEETLNEWITRLQQLAVDYNTWEQSLEFIQDTFVAKAGLLPGEIDAIMAMFIGELPAVANDFAAKLTDPMAQEYIDTMVEIVRASGKAPKDMSKEFLAGKSDMAIAVGLFTQQGIIDVLDSYEPIIQERGKRLKWAMEQGFTGETTEAITYIDRDVAKIMLTVENGMKVGGVYKTFIWAGESADAMAAAFAARAPDAAASIAGDVALIMNRAHSAMTSSPEYVTETWGGEAVGDLAHGWSAGKEPAAASMEETTKAILESGVLGPLVALGAEMKDTVELALTGLNDQIKVQEDYLADLDEATKQITESQQAWGDEVDRLGGLLDAANDDLRKFTDAQIEGTGWYDDALFSLGIQMDKLNLKINDLKQQKLGLDDESSKAKALDKDIEALEEELDGLGLKADELQLKERIRFDPLRREIEDLTDTTEEMSFEDIIAGITKTQGVIEDLTDAVAGATSQVEAHDAILKVLSKSQEYHQEILDGVKDKYGELTEALEDIGPDLAKIADSMGEGYAEALQNAFKAMEAGNTLTAGDALAAAQTLFDDLEVLIQGSGQEQLLVPLGDVLADAQALFAGTFQIEIPAAVTAGEAPLKKAGETVAVALTEGFIDAMGGAAVQLADAGLAAATGLAGGFRGGMPDIIAVTQECLETFVDNMGGPEAIVQLGEVGMYWQTAVQEWLGGVRNIAAQGGTDAAIAYVEKLIVMLGDNATPATDALKVLLDQLKQIDYAEDAGSQTGQALTGGLEAAIETAAPALATSVGSVIDGVKAELESRMADIAFWAGLTATAISTPLMQALGQMARDLAAGNAMAVEEGSAALAGYINWLEMNGYPGTADALQKIMLLYKTAAEDMIKAGEEGVGGLADALIGGLPGVTDAAGNVINAAVGEVKTAGEKGMPPAADATMVALRQGLYAFQTEAGQWGATTMAWVCAGMFTYMAKDGRSYAQATGRTFIDGIIEGLNQEEGSLYDRIEQIIEAAIAAANEAAGVGGGAAALAAGVPALEFGGYIARSGLAHLDVGEIVMPAGWGQPALKLDLASLGAGGRQVSNTFSPNITVYAQSGNPTDIASEVERATRKAFGSMVQRMQAMEPTLGA